MDNRGEARDGRGRPLCKTVQGFILGRIGIIGAAIVLLLTQSVTRLEFSQGFRLRRPVLASTFRRSIWTAARPVLINGCESQGEALPVHRLPILLAALLVFASACSRQVSGERPIADYDKTTGRLRRIEFDANKNGKNDAVGFMDGTQILRVELDLDENGKVERWDFYGHDHELEKVGFSGRNDGVMDSVAFYQPDGVVSRIELSSKRDGTFNRVEFYKHGSLDRSEEDTDGDRRPDKWETYRPNSGAGPNEPGYAIASVAFDDSKRGTPNRRLVYGESGTIARVEMDPDGTGTFTSVNRSNNHNSSPLMAGNDRHKP